MHTSLSYRFGKELSQHVYTMYTNYLDIINNSDEFLSQSACIYYDYLYLTTPTVCQYLVVNQYDAHLSFHCVKLNKCRLRCTKII